MLQSIVLHPENSPNAESHQDTFLDIPRKKYDLSKYLSKQIHVPRQNCTGARAGGTRISNVSKSFQPASKEMFVGL